VPELRRGNEDYRVNQRPRCGRRDSEAPREGRGEVTSRSAERGSSLSRFLNLMSVAAACAGCVREGGRRARGRGSRALFRVTPYRPPAPDDSGNRPTRASPPWDPKRRPNTVVVWTRSKGNSYRSGRQGRVSCGVKVPAPSIARFGGLAYPMHASVTAYVPLGRKSHGRPVDYPQRWERPGWRANLEART